MIPLQDENPSRRIPFINGLLILINLAVFIYQHYVYPWGAAPLFLRLGCVPYEFTHFVDIDPRAAVPVPVTAVTAMFMHAGWLHLLGNMLFLWVFGDNIEDKLGHLRYLFFYLACGLAASLAHIVANPYSKVPSLGASGAIAGVMGAYLFLYPRARIKTLFIFLFFIRVIRIPAFLLLGYWILIQMLSGLAESGSGGGGGIAWFAHIGGFGAGFALIILMRKGKRRR